MCGYFSQNFETNGKSCQLTNQVLFLVAQDFFTPESVTEESLLEFTVRFSNGEQTVYGKDSKVPRSDFACLEFPPYRDVASVELKGISVPLIENESFFVVDIPEFNNRIHSSSNPNVHEKFAIVYFDKVADHSTKYEVQPLRGSDYDTKIKVFNPPLARLNKFTVRICKFNGDVINMKDIINIPSAGDNIKKQNAIFDGLKHVSFLFEFVIRA